MNLRNNQITVRELLSNPNARTFLMREIPEIMNNPIIRTAGNLRLSEVMRYANGHMPRYRIEALINGLQRL